MASCQTARREATGRIHSALTQSLWHVSSSVVFQRKGVFYSAFFKLSLKRPKPTKRGLCFVFFGCDVE